MAARLLRIRGRTSYVDQVYETLLDAICDGSLAPGSRITQEDVATQLAVSRSPVLQALRMLKKDGLLRDAPGRGVMVTPLDTTWLCDLYQIRGALDSLAAQLAAMRNAQIDRKLITRGKHSAKERNAHSMISADMEFHFAVYTASGNRLIAETARFHWVHLKRVMGAALQASAQSEAIWDEHESIAEAICRGDAAAAALHSELHSRRACEHLAARLGIDLSGQATSVASDNIDGVTRTK